MNIGIEDATEDKCPRCGVEYDVTQGAILSTDLDSCFWVSIEYCPSCLRVWRTTTRVKE